MLKVHPPAVPRAGIAVASLARGCSLTQELYTLCEAASIRGTYLTLFEDRMRRHLHVWLDRSHFLYNPKQRLFAPLLLRHAAADAAVAAAAVAAAVATLPTS